jgi:ATP-dependent DNA ligase
MSGVAACARLACKTALIEREMVVQDENGLAAFDALRDAIHRAPHRIRVGRSCSRARPSLCSWRVPKLSGS